MTVFALCMNTRTGVVRFANAGHNPPVLLSGTPTMLEMDTGIALGFVQDSGIIEEELKLKPGEGILIYTDGITEAINAEKKQYGEVRLRESVNHSFTGNGGRYDARILVSDIAGSVRRFSGKKEQFDDITCCAVVYKDCEEELAPDMASFSAVKQTLTASFGNSEKTKKWILACEEIYANIVEYSGADSVSFAFERTGEICAVTFTDNGTAFDPVKAVIHMKDPEDLDTGGMGIMIARNLSREILYNRIGERNILTLRFES